jgi:hypothetical protein
MGNAQQALLDLPLNEDCAAYLAGYLKVDDMLALVATCRELRDVVRGRIVGRVLGRELAFNATDPDVMWRMKGLTPASCARSLSNVIMHLVVSQRVIALGEQRVGGSFGGDFIRGDSVWADAIAQIPRLVRLRFVGNSDYTAHRANERFFATLANAKLEIRHLSLCCVSFDGMFTELVRSCVPSLVTLSINFRLGQHTRTMWANFARAKNLTKLVLTHTSLDALDYVMIGAAPLLTPDNVLCTM